MKRAAVYMRVSTLDQHPETQRLDLRQLAAQRGYEIVAEYPDRISGAKARRPGLDAMMRDARRGRFDVVLVWACDRIARSTRHRPPLDFDRAAIVRDRAHGQSLAQLARAYCVSRTTIHRVLHEQPPHAGTPA